MWVVCRLLEYCRQNEAYTGVEFSTTDEDRDTDDLLTRLSDLKLDGAINCLLLFYFRCNIDFDAEIF